MRLRIWVLSGSVTKWSTKRLSKVLTNRKEWINLGLQYNSRVNKRNKYRDIKNLRDAMYEVIIVLLMTDLLLWQGFRNCKVAV